MKMSKETYSVIENAINGLIDYVEDKNEITELRKNINFANDQFTAFAFKMFYTSCKYAKQVQGTDILALVRNEGLNNDHIGTAIKKILVRYK